MRWFIATGIALLLFSGLMPWLRRFGLGRLPGDLNFRWLGRDWSIPVMSTLVLSLLAAALARWI
jgi:hypothetical protein